jgi:hypothetical protein
VPVRVLLARLREDTKYPGSVLVYIKKADSKATNTHDKGIPSKRKPK